MIFSINSPPQVLFGSGSSEQTGQKLKELGCRKVLCVHGKNVQKSGIADRVISAITNEGIEVVRFAEVVADPPDEVIEKGAAIAKKEEVDGIVGIGGGSALDTAKAINVLLGNPSPITRYHDKSIEILPGKVLVLLPTTAGTGSEVNNVSVVTDTKKNVKSGVKGKACVADLAIVDPQFTLGLPARATAITGMDTLAHGIESMTTILANPMADMLDEKVIELVTRFLPVAVENGNDLKARTNLSFAAMLAGMAFDNTVLHLGHAIAHSMGAVYHIPHGIACSIALPEVIEYIVDVHPEKIKTIGSIMGLNLEGLSIQETGKAVAGKVRDFAKSMGMPTMKELNLDKNLLEKVAEMAPHDDCAAFMPKEAPQETILELLYKAYER
ncbi:MAG TPA: iron-containing alcohol dehydrogenase [Bacillota bacterium]|nr:iron-containing alcohol dehydrogenase [Bacillota bacterium]HOA36388.1 iron-containing alcohol dehydrogenase [Bacillota bacterium]HOJ84926.1 iron-containing alcohol dehydrogenase [Bacillota bacterium]HOL15712.1 iron-containing alcohol dehydrogenase [Bacillota bacterium]HPZ11962.1 iron-containing alcohol dehydrogenase [Bacillota bacterium]